MISPLVDAKTFVHMGMALRENAPRVAARVDGVVLTGEHRGPIHAALRASGRPIIIQEPGRLLAQPPALFPPEELWMMSQVGAVEAYTNPVRYLPSPKDRPREAAAALAEAANGAAAFRRVVEQQAPRESVLTLFALHYHWLTYGLQNFRTALRDVEGPIGLMVSHDADPFDSPRRIEGMLELIRDSGVAVLRTDTAGLGFRAHGAMMTSIGIGTGTRHYPPPDHQPFANLDDDSPRLFLPLFGDFWRGTRVAASGDDDYFRCYCGVCRGMSLARFIDSATASEAAEHTVDSWMGLSIQMESTSLSRRTEWWTSYVLSCLAAIKEFEDRTYSVQTESRQLTAWTRALGVTAS